MSDKDFGSNRQGDLPAEGHDAAVLDGPPSFAVFWLGNGTFPAAVIDDLNGYITGGSGRCLEALEARGVQVFRKTSEATAAVKVCAVGTDERSEEVNQNTQVIP
jgi:hypothetical protein